MARTGTVVSSPCRRSAAKTWASIRRISDVTERGKHLVFTYNRDSKPTSITLRGGGTIKVEYDANGEIASVNSDGGVAMALKVTKTFQSLLELVRPANVKIGL